jgi:2-dehydropantoate 2-reductase
MTKKINILSIGAGAIGTYIGGSLAISGQEVVFVERPEVAAKIQERGLHLTLDKDHHIPAPRVVGSLAEALELQKFDVALFALKSFDTRTFLEASQELHPVMPPILCLSNGVANEPLLAQYLGPERVIAGTVTTAIGRREGGGIILERLRGVGVSAKHPLSEELVAALGVAGLQAEAFSHAAAMKWSKMLTNLIANATSAILNMSPAEVFAHPGLYQLEIEQLRETLAVMKAQNIPVVDLPGTPVRLLDFAIRWLPLAVSRPLLAKKVAGGRGAKMPSFHIDLHGGRGQSEVDYLNGAVMRAGQASGIKTPVNRRLTEILLELTNHEIPLDQFDHQPEKLIATIA